MKKLNKANLVGLTSPEQQSEMKAILNGTWPPLKPLPVFKYEAAEYRATISFDRNRGEWVCRKTSLPSNEVQELRGALSEITMALPHGDAEVFIEGAEPQEQELEKDAHRRLQAIREWREKYENGARYFEMREYMSESQRTELDDSLRLSLTARQLQFNAKNAANVFDDLSVAGGRFAALIEFAMRNKAKQGTDASAPEEVTLHEAESAIAEKSADILPEAIDRDEPSLEIALPELGSPLSNNDPIVPPQETIEPCADANEFPALSIKNVFPEPDQPSMGVGMAHTASQQFAIEDTEIAAVDLDSPSLAEPPHQEGRHSAFFAGFPAQVPTSPSFADRLAAGSFWRFPRLEISAFQVNVFALLLLFAVTSFIVGLTVGRGPLGKRLREPPQSLLAKDAKPTTLPDSVEPDGADESTPRTQPTQVASSDDSARINRPENATPSVKPTASEEKPEESPRISDSVEARSTDPDSSPAIESRPTPKSEVNPAPIGTIGPVVRNAPLATSPKLVRPSSRLARRSRAVRSFRSPPRNPVPYRLTSATDSAPHAPRPSTILVTVPDRGSQPFRVSFPNKTIAATSSLAMTSQLSVLVSAEARPAAAHKSARLEAGELVSFGWPRYANPRDRYGLAETIKVRATIGQYGQVEEVKFLSGSASLLPATTEAVRQWRYTPTLLDKRPVQAQQDVTIEFRPPQYSARLSTPHPSHN